MSHSTKKMKAVFLNVMLLFSLSSISQDCANELLAQKPGTLNGYPLYEGNYNRTGQRYSRAIILTRTGQSPYLPVTQKQFLKAFLNYNEKQNLKTLTFLENKTVKTDEEEEADKKKNLEIIERVTPADKLARAKDNFLRNYFTSRQQKEAWINDTKKRYEEDMNPARDLLANSPEQELEQPAFLDFDNLLEFKDFSTEEKGGRQLVSLNPNYLLCIGAGTMPNPEISGEPRLKRISILML